MPRAEIRVLQQTCNVRFVGEMMVLCHNAILAEAAAPPDQRKTATKSGTAFNAPLSRPGSLGLHPHQTTTHLEEFLHRLSRQPTMLKQIVARHHSG
mmetsp:Transcript_109576/g.251279  ORF Transcript_109576/g.251279 Transcript_109576/m.251279 type:complete len:96 (+) Transcript_109576:420-707(+)